MCALKNYEPRDHTLYHLLPGNVRKILIFGGRNGKLLQKHTVGEMNFKQKEKIM